MKRFNKRPSASRSSVSKPLTSLIGIAVIGLAIITLSLTGCGDSATGDPTSPGGGGGEKLPTPPAKVDTNEQAKEYFGDVFDALTTDEEKASFFEAVLEMVTEDMEKEEKEALMDFLSKVEQGNFSLDDVPDEVWELVVDKWSDIKEQIKDLVDQENEDRNKPSGGDGGNELPAAKGANALSGKTYIEWSRKIEFSTTAEDEASGTYTVLSAKRDSNGQYDLKDGKYDYVEIETGNYSWDEDAKTVTTAPEKIAFGEGNRYGALQSKADYRAAMQAEADKMGGAAALDAVKEMGFSSVAAYLDYLVAETFKNVTRNYVFSADDNNALFLDEVLPANKGTNELNEQTYNGTTWNNDKPKKDTSQTYVFTAEGCTYTRTNGNGDSSYRTYIYAYDSTAKRVYLKTPTDGREARYKQISNNTNVGNFASADEYNAAEVNGQYGRLEERRYDLKEKTLQ